ncbi:hypothetical protein ACULNC_20605 [Shigella flexneri]
MKFSKIHRHALWEIPDGVDYEDAAVLDPICNAYKSIAQQSKFLPGRMLSSLALAHWAVFHQWRGLWAVNRHHWSARCGGPLPGCKRTGGDGSSKWFYRRYGGALPANLWQDNLGLVIECSGANIALKRPSKCFARMGKWYALEWASNLLIFSINDITAWNKSIIGHMAYDSTSWRNAIRLLASGAIKVKPMITHRIGLSQWREGFDAMVDKTAIKVIMTYDFDE